MNQRILLRVTILGLFVISCSNKHSVSVPAGHKSLRVLGYLHSPGDWLRGINAVDLAQITDLNLAFINPDASGNFPANPVYHEVIKKAHEKNVSVFLSLGGGNPPPHLESMMEKNHREKFIRALVDFAETYAFDGIDVDLENALINQHYAGFVSDLHKALQPRKKLMTAALASWNADLIHDSTLALYDFINVMSYDKTGPWNLAKPGQHSPYSMVQDDFTYFNQKRKIPAGRIFIGLPFYGYGFGTGAPSSMSYKDIIATYPGSEQGDTLNVAGGGTIYYNGIATIKQKVLYAIQNKAGGVMIWQLLGDTKNDKSLLRTISLTKNE